MRAQSYLCGCDILAGWLGLCGWGGGKGTPCVIPSHKWTASTSNPFSVSPQHALVLLTRLKYGCNCLLSRDASEYEFHYVLWSGIPGSIQGQSPSWKCQCIILMERLLLMHLGLNLVCRWICLFPDTTVKYTLELEYFLWIGRVILHPQPTLS